MGNLSFCSYVRVSSVEVAGRMIVSYTRVMTDRGKGFRVPRSEYEFRVWAFSLFGCELHPKPSIAKGCIGIYCNFEPPMLYIAFYVVIILMQITI